MSTKPPTDWRNLPPVPEAERPTIREDFIPSQTFLRHHDRCDRAAMLYLTYRAGAGGHELNRGTIVHETWDRCLRWLAERQGEFGGALGGSGDYVPSPEERVEQAAASVPPEVGREFLIETMKAHPELQVNSQERDACRYMVDHLCRGTYFPNTIIGIETTLTLEINGFVVLIRPDLIEDLGGGICQITDWKTAFPPDSETFVRQAYDRDGNPRWAGNFQLNMGAVVAHFGKAADGLPLGDFSRYRLVLGYPRELRADGIVRRIIDVDERQLHTYKDDLALQLDRLRDVNIAEGRWQPTPGNHCRECPAELKCPLPAVLREEAQLAEANDLADLERLAASSNFMSDRATKLKSRIKKRAEQLEEESPGILDLPGGDRGVRIGKGLAFVFNPYEQETVKDKLALQQAMDDARHGAEIDVTDHFRRSEGVKFEKRRVET